MMGSQPGEWRSPWPGIDLLTAVCRPLGRHGTLSRGATLEPDACRFGQPPLMPAALPACRSSRALTQH